MTVTSVSVVVRGVRTAAGDRDIDEIRADLGKFCPVARVLRPAGTRVTETWNVERG